MPTRKKAERRHRITAPSGTTFTLTDRGSRGWWVEIQLRDQERVRERLCRGDRAAAQRQAIARVAELERLAVAAGTPTFARVAAEMIVAKIKGGQAENYTRKIKEHWGCYIQPQFGPDVPIAAISSAELLAFKHLLAASDLKPQTCNRVLTSLRQIFKYAEDPCGYCIAPALPRNFPVANWDAPEKWHLLVPEEIGTLLAHAPGEACDLFGYLANTGLRVGAALRTEVEWIDWRKGLVHYPASSMKGRYPHTVELNPFAETYLRQALDRSPKKPWPFQYWYYLKRWIATREAAGMLYVRIHDLRHSFVSNLLDAGTPIHVVKELAAHRSLAVTALYAHATNEARRAAVNRVQIGVGSKVPETARERGAVTPEVTPKENAGLVTRRNQMPRDGIEPPTRGFSVPCSTN